MKLTVVGLGYIGLPTSIMFAKHGVDVLGVDVNPQVVESLNSGQIHIKEPGLQEAYENVLKMGTFKVELEPAKSDVFIISVPTPKISDENKSCDNKYLMQALENILPYLENGNTVIVESTLAPRTMNDEIKPFFEQNGLTIGEDIYLVHCPERVLPGKILEELVYNNRIIGGITEKCVEAGKRVYGTFVRGEMIETNAKTAEMSKLMENTFRDFNIGLANELSKICNNLEINVLDVIEMANKHPRVNIHQPGPGVGGHCLAVDPYFIIAKDPEESKLIQLARQTNKSMSEYIIKKTKDVMNKVDGKKVTIFGLTYKGDVDDVRESPALDIYQKLKGIKDIDVVAYDPHVNLEFIEKDINKAVENSSIVLILSDHSEFKYLSDRDFKSMKDKIILDTKNIVKSEFNEVLYFDYGNLYEIEKNINTVLK
ncbi:nucleotide sugar dehydrogenase [Mammaliicoccus lentus]|uniref:nucleotide sugar dehydrogenase n=1 Tax=Mammaliicoccus lentus TaxID=42858 RepID=UPI001C4F7230|nr:nucleotide sugar dehydrogenase [Mammaliicoccus lentus]MBW0762655.1 nucleotide sugar dehydrogenase [Mammaliicoccus lentus]